MELFVFVVILIIGFMSSKKEEDEYRPTYKSPNTNKDNYLEYLTTQEWRTKADASKARDDYTCKRCGSKKYLQTHHITYKRLYNERDEDLTTLCNDCHKYVHLVAGKNAGYYPVVK